LRHGVECGPMPNVIAAQPNIEPRRCSNEAKTRNPLKFAGYPKLANGSQPLWAEVHHIVGTSGGDITV